MATEKFEDAKRAAISKEAATKAAVAELKKLNPELTIKAQVMDHFHHGWGVAIQMENYMHQTMVNGRGLITPKGWEVKDQPNTNTFQLIIPNEQTLFIRVTKRVH